MILINKRNNNWVRKWNLPLARLTSSMEASTPRQSSMKWSPEQLSAGPENLFSVIRSMIWSVARSMVRSMVRSVMRSVVRYGPIQVLSTPLWKDYLSVRWALLSGVPLLPYANEAQFWPDMVQALEGDPFRKGLQEVRQYELFRYQHLFLKFFYLKSFLIFVKLFLLSLVNDCKATRMPSLIS